MDLPQLRYCRRSLSVSTCLSLNGELPLSLLSPVFIGRADLGPASKLLLTFVFVHFFRFQVTCVFLPSQVFLSPWRSLFRCALSPLPPLSAASQALSNAPFPVSLARAIAPFLTSQLRWRLPFLFLSWDVPFPFPPSLLELPNVQALPTFFFPLPSDEREPPWGTLLKFLLKTQCASKIAWCTLRAICTPRSGQLLYSLFWCSQEVCWAIKSTGIRFTGILALFELLWRN